LSLRKHNLRKHNRERLRETERERACVFRDTLYSSVTETRMGGIGEMVPRFNLKPQSAIDIVPNAGAYFESSP
jgi:hypothetical protein